MLVQVVSGLAKYMSLEELQGRRVVIVANLKPRKHAQGAEPGDGAGSHSSRWQQGEPVGQLAATKALPGGSVLITSFQGMHLC